MQAARALGASNWRLVTRHILPNSLAPVLVYATISVGAIIAAEATLSFLGVGLRLPAISWGLMIGDRAELPAHLAAPADLPGLFLSLTVLRSSPSATPCATPSTRSCGDGRLRPRASPTRVGERSTTAGRSPVPLLEVDDLSSSSAPTPARSTPSRGELAPRRRARRWPILGESGSGKSVSAQAVMGILESPPARITSGAIRFRGRDLLTCPEDEQRKVRGAQIAMVFQDALSALNPVFTVGAQIAEMFRVHRGSSKRRGAWPRPPSSWTGCASPAHGSASTTTRTSSPAACGSA